MTNPEALNDEALDDVTGGGFTSPPFSRDNLSMEQPELGIIVVDEDGINGPNDQYPGKAGIKSGSSV